MTAAQVDRELAAHDLVEHDLEDPGWNRRSAQLLHRKITLSARRAGENLHEGGQTAPSAASTAPAGPPTLGNSTSSGGETRLRDSFTAPTVAASFDLKG